MIRFGYDHPETGRTMLLGLTDVNVRRMTSDRPIKVDLRESDPIDTLVIFHATRQTLVQIADQLGVDQKLLLDQLGEG